MYRETLYLCYQNSKWGSFACRPKAHSGGRGVVKKERSLLFKSYTFWKNNGLLRQSQFLLNPPKKNDAVALCQARPIRLHPEFLLPFKNTVPWKMQMAAARPSSWLSWFLVAVLFRRLWSLCVLTGVLLVAQSPALSSTPTCCPSSPQLASASMRLAGLGAQCSTSHPHCCSFLGQEGAGSIARPHGLQACCHANALAPRP